MTRRWLRWIPAVAVPAVIAAAVVAAPLRAGADTPLPEKSPVDVLVMAATHQVRALSGTVEQDSDLGLPQLPSGGPTAAAGGASILELLGSSHTARVYADGATKVRVQVMDQLAERDFVRNGSELWLYSSRDNTATHVIGLEMLHAHKPGGVVPDEPTHTAPTPQDIAQRFLAKIDPSTSVELGPEVRLAGRSAYQLLLTPRTSETLVASVAVYVDGQSGLPLGVEVKARGQEDPAFRLVFSDLSITAPDASLFQFSPPPGATVKEIGLASDMPMPAPGTEPQPVPVPDSTRQKPDVTGTGWDAVVELPAAVLQQVLDSTPVLAQAAVEVPGGRLLPTSLLNVLMTDDGRVFAGSVPLERLQAVAAAP